MVLFLLAYLPTFFFAASYFQNKSVSTAPMFNTVETLDTMTPETVVTDVAESAWLTYANDIFTVQHPENWQLEQVLEATVTTADDGTFVKAGSITLSTPAEMIMLTFGDGFGGANCGTPDTAFAGGELVNVWLFGGTVAMCRIPTFAENSSEIISYEFGNICGDCSIIKNAHNQLDNSSYAFYITSRSSELSQSEIQGILDSFMFIQK